MLSGSKLLAETASAKKKVLVVYYSWSGNTRRVANMIKDYGGFDVYEAVPEKAYPSVYRQTVDQARKEIDDGYKPPLKSKIDNLDDYDTIVLGSPRAYPK